MSSEQRGEELDAEIAGNGSQTKVSTSGCRNLAAQDPRKTRAIAKTPVKTEDRGNSRTTTLMTHKFRNKTPAARSKKTTSRQAKRASNMAC